jgi:chromosome segregation ATPase
VSHWKAQAAIYDIRPEDMRERLLQALEAIYIIADELEVEASEDGILDGIESLREEVIEANNTAEENSQAFEQLEELEAQLETKDTYITKLQQVLTTAINSIEAVMT